MNNDTSFSLEEIKEMNSNSPLVEVGIPTYNQENFITHTINSVIQQTYNTLHVIVKDDASTDTTASIVDGLTLNEKVRYVGNKKNLGRVANYRDLLYNHTKGDWYLNLDGDDFFTDEHFISHAISVIYNSISGEVVFFQGNHNKKKLKEIYPSGIWLNETDILLDGKEYFLNYPSLASFTHCATIYNRKKAIEVDFYNFDCLFSDFNSLAKLSLTGKVILSSKAVACWRQHGLNQSKGLNETQLAIEIESLRNILQFASPYLDKGESLKWMQKMENLVESRFLDMALNSANGKQVLKMILRRWKFNIYYLKAFSKSLYKVLLGR